MHSINLPSDFNTNLLMLFRWVHFIAGVTWIGYRVPMVAGPRQMCCFDKISDSTISGGMCRLESGSGVWVGRCRGSHARCRRGVRRARRRRKLGS